MLLILDLTRYKLAGFGGGSLNILLQTEPTLTPQGEHAPNESLIMYGSPLRIPVIKHRLGTGIPHFSQLPDTT
jgi:hypothetical protein